jgi:hypothetical protein
LANARNRPRVSALRTERLATIGSASRQEQAPGREASALSGWTNTRCAGPASSDACSARAKRESARGRWARSELVRSERPHRPGGDDCIQAKAEVRLRVEPPQSVPRLSVRCGCRGGKLELRC